MNLTIKTLSNIKSKLNIVELEIKKNILELSKTTNTSNLYFSQKRIELSKLFREINNIFKETLSDSIPVQFQESMRGLVQKIKSYKTLQNQGLNWKEIVNKDSSKQSYKSILNNGISNFSYSLATGEKKINQLLYITQQINISEKTVNQALSEGLESGQFDFNKSKKALKNALLNNVLEDKIVTVINKNGQEINYSVSSYADLVARTKLREVQTATTIVMANETDTDLVQVSAHNATDDCSEYEGKIFSLSGKNPDFPIAEELPPFHPNCIHTILPVYEQLLKLDGTYDKYVQFSNNEIEEHPTRTEFIPVSQRG